jgi:hypothetical protein
MRRYFFVLATLLASAATFNAARQAKAETTNPVCRASGGDEQGSLRCDFASFDQCRATTSGTGGFCVTNPEYTSNASANYRVHVRHIR